MQINETRSAEHTSELQSQSTNSYAGFCLKKKKDDEVLLVDFLDSRRVVDENRGKVAHGMQGHDIDATYIINKLH